MYITSVLMASTIFSCRFFCQIGRYRLFNPTSEAEKDHFAKKRVSCLEQ